MSTNRPSSTSSFDRVRDRVLIKGNRLEIEGLIKGIDDRDRVHEWVQFEENNRNRQWVLQLLGRQAAVIHAGGDRDD